MSKKILSGCCPHCGSTRPLEQHYSYMRVRCQWDWGGTCIGEHMDVAYRKGGDILYCSNCDQPVGKIEELIDLY